jgi:hypothetical protein
VTYQPLLGHDALHGALELRHEGKLNQAELLLLCAQPTPAVADELRKVYVAKAKLAADREDWLAVMGYLGQYTIYVRDAESAAIGLVNQPMPRHNARAYSLHRRAFENAIRLGLPTMAGPELTEPPIPGPAECARIYNDAREHRRLPDVVFRPLYPLASDDPEDEIT